MLILKIAEEFKKLTGKNEFTPVSFSEGLEDLKKFADAGSAAKEKWLEAQEVIKTTPALLSQELEDLDSKMKNRGVIFEYTPNVQNLADILRKVQQSGKATLQDSKDFVREFKELEKKYSSVNWLGNKKLPVPLRDDLIRLDRAFGFYEKIRKAQEIKDPGPNRAEQLLQQLSKPASEAGQNLSEGMKAATPAIEDVSVRLNLIRGQAVDIGQIIASWKAPDLQLGQLANPQPRMALFGGSIGYFSSGGLAKGTDTIPAMLSPGEFVMSANATGKFFSQIQALNSGIQPVYRQSGGSVTNIGDISINVNESQTPQQTARQVLSSIRRELRRGSSRL